MSYISRTEIDELDITKCKVLGVCYQSSSKTHGYIFPVALDINGEYKKIQQLSDAYELFPSDGGIFYYEAYNAEKDYYIEQDSINIIVRVRGDSDDKIEASKVKKLGYKPWVYANSNLSDEYTKKKFSVDLFSSTREFPDFPILVNVGNECMQWTSSGYIDIEELHVDTSYLSNGCKFYLKHQNQDNIYVFGPFKAKEADDSFEIRAFTGKSVKAYTIPSTTFMNTFSFTGALFADYLINEQKLNKYAQPTNIDCSTYKQLVDWLKANFAKKLSEDNNTKLEEINSIFNKLRDIDPFELDKDMPLFNRAIAKIDNIDKYMDWEEAKYKNISELLLQKSDKFRRYAESRVKEYIEHARENADKEIQDYLDLAEEAKTEYETTKSKNDSALKAILDDIAKKKASAEEAQKSLDALIDKKEDIINTIKLQLSLGLIGSTSGNHTDSNVPIPYYQTLSPEGSFEKDDPSLNHILFLNMVKINTNDKYKAFLNNLNQNNDSLISRRAMFIPCASWAYLYANAIGNSKLLCMSVEHDWLHFKDFAEHGLLQIWNNAHSDSDTNYVLLLEGMNITTVECGLRPLLDVIDKIRPTLANTNLPMPKNLKIFATILSTEDEMGTPMRSERFKRWGAVGTPGEELQIDFENLKSRYYMPPAVIGTIRTINTDTSEDIKEKYFAF